MTTFSLSSIRFSGAQWHICSFWRLESLVVGGKRRKRKNTLGKIAALSSIPIQSSETGGCKMLKMPIWINSPTVILRFFLLSRF